MTAMDAANPNPGPSTGLAPAVLELLKEGGPGTIRVCQQYGKRCAWSLPADLFRDHAAHFRQTLPKEFTLDDEGALEVFIESVLTGSWRARPVKVDLTSMSMLGFQEEAPDVDSLNWQVKASIYACQFGVTIGAPKFHNYAMKQLFEAFHTKRMPLSARIAIHACHGKGHLADFIQNLIIRDWNEDMGIIHSSDPDWEEFFEDKQFRPRFIKEIGMSHEAKKTHQLKLDDYLMNDLEPVQRRADNISKRKRFI
ncbi:hypothetical protein BDV96DRAFT_644851 [Lophiotrema nucula]|uniref:Uncharacterized protein n=1 Tax=Lophiotrema nucula TaxID=690887 RepID=A0A6A5ZD38_9PLEO|nr:hypothetical protein BDV96DRAFT_644851 [Lophiotrema nucula]